MCCVLGMHRYHSVIYVHAQLVSDHCHGISMYVMSRVLNCGIDTGYWCISTACILHFLLSNEKRGGVKDDEVIQPTTTEKCQITDAGSWVSHSHILASFSHISPTSNLYCTCLFVFCFFSSLLIFQIQFPKPVSEKQPHQAAVDVGAITG